MTIEEAQKQIAHLESCYDTLLKQYDGLCDERRFEAAKAAMQGLLVNNRVTHKREMWAEELKTLGTDAVAAADSLLTALSESKEMG